MVLEVVPRSEWSLVKPNSTYPIETPSPNVFSAYTYTQMCTTKDKCTWLLRLMQDRHMNRSKKPDIKFSFLIGGDGRVYEGRGWGVTPDLPLDLYNFNKNSLYIVYIGEFKHFDVPTYMKSRLCELINYGIDNNHIEKNYYYELLIK